MIYLFLDCDEYLVAERISALKDTLGDPEMADLNTATLAGQRTSVADLLGHAGMMPFLTNKRLVVVDGMLAHLDKRMAASKETNSAAYVEAAQLLTGVPDVPDECDVVFVESGLDKRRHLWRGFSMSDDSGVSRKVPGLQQLVKEKVIEQESLSTPDARALPAWIQRRAREQNISIDGRAVQMLAAYVGPNLRLLDNELRKLATYAAGRSIAGDDVDLLVSDASEAVIWTLTDALSQRNARRAMHTLQTLRRGDANAFYLLTMMARQYRIMLKVKEAMSESNRSGGIPGNEHEIAKMVGESPYPVKKAMQQCRQYSMQDLVSVLERLLAADHAMKTGTDADTEIDVLVAELTAQ